MSDPQTANVVTPVMAMQKELVRQLLALLAGGQAHVDFSRAFAGLPAGLRGVRPEHVPYSAWQLVEHLRIAQRDILDFCTDADGAGYRHLAWPEAYWPESPEPPTTSAWDEAIEAIVGDRERFAALLTAPDADLLTPFKWGEGQNLLREATLLADHNAYHLGELVLLRRLLGAWQG